MSPVGCVPLLITGLLAICNGRSQAASFEPPPPNQGSGAVSTAGWNHDDISALEPGEASGPTLEPGEYFVYVAPVGPANISWQKRGWRQYGPFALRAGKRYEVNADGRLEERGESFVPERCELRYRNSANIDMSFYAKSAGPLAAQPAPPPHPAKANAPGASGGSPPPPSSQKALSVGNRHADRPQSWCGCR